MKRFTAMLLAICLLCAVLTACSEQAPDATTAAPHNGSADNSAAYHRTAHYDTAHHGWADKERRPHRLDH